MYDHRNITADVNVNNRFDKRLNRSYVNLITLFVVLELFVFPSAKSDVIVVQSGRFLSKFIFLPMNILKRFSFRMVKHE